MVPKPYLLLWQALIIFGGVVCASIPVVTEQYPALALIILAGVLAELAAWITSPKNRIPWHGFILFVAVVIIGYKLVGNTWAFGLGPILPFAGATLTRVYWQKLARSDWAGYALTLWLVELLLQGLGVETWLAIAAALVVAELMAGLEVFTTLARKLTGSELGQIGHV